MGGVGDALTPRDRHVRPIRTHEKQAKMGKREENDEKGMKKTKGRNQRETKKDIFSILRENLTVLSVLSRLHPQLHQTLSSLSGHSFRKM